MNTIATTFSSKHFSFNETSGEFCAEISSLQYLGNPLERLYPDAGDQGFVMVSKKTGKEVDFVLKRVQRDAEGDIVFWEFEPSWYHIFGNPALRGVHAVILND